MSAHRVLLLIAAIAVAAGVIVGFVPVSASGTNCGSAFVASNDPLSADMRGAVRADFTGGTYEVGSVQAACDSLRSVVRIPAIILLAVGAGLGFTGLYLRDQASTPQTPRGPPNRPGTPA